MIEQHVVSRIDFDRGLLSREHFHNIIHEFQASIFMSAECSNNHRFKWKEVDNLIEVARVQLEWYLGLASPRNLGIMPVEK